MTTNQKYAEEIEQCLDRLTELIDDSGIANMPIEYYLAQLREAIRPHLKDLQKA